MAVNQITRPTRAQTQLFSKPALYAAVADLNRDLQLVLDDFRRLRQFRFSREFMDAVEVQIEELRAWSNGELLETQLDRELTDWAHWGRRHRTWEKRLRDPGDVLIEADRPRQKQAAKRPTTKSQTL